MTWRPCVECGEPSPDSRCPDHALPSVSHPSTSAGYDHRWRRLSERARRLQPFCTDCGTRDDLTTDHSPEAWQRRAEGKLITLDLVTVVCRSCNSKRGRARPRGGDPRGTAGEPRVKAEGQSHLGVTW